jgi:hypothetical protein
MKRIVQRNILLLLFIGAIACPASGYYSYGARAVGMGTAFTGMTNDASIFYWNPGGLVVLPGWMVELQYGRDAVYADDVRDTMESMKQWYDEGGESDERLAEGMRKLESKNWLFRGGDAMSFVIANQHMAMFFNQQQIYYVQPDDSEHQMEQIPAGGSDEGDWRYRLSGIDLREYGMSFTILGGESGFSLGVSGKYIHAEAYHSTPDFTRIDAADPDTLADLVESGESESSSRWSLDAGIIMAFGPNRLGISARNIKKYTIDIGEDASVTIKPEYRIGYVFQPAERFVFAMDYSIGKEHDLLGNRLDGKELAAGFEGVFGRKKWLFLRGGVSMPLEGDAPMILSLGSGLAFESAVFDVGYAFDRNRDSDKLWFGLRFTF